MAQTLKFGKGTWATKTGSSMAYNDQNGNYKPLPFNVERDSIATRVNKEGLIEVVGKDKLRIDYTDSAKGVALLENSATNLITYSEDFSQSSWAGGNVTRELNQIISPDGTLNATKLSATASFSQIQQSYTSVNNTDYTLSVFVKSPSSNVVGLRLASGSNDVRREFNLSTLSIQSMGGNNQELIDEGIVDFGSGWYRIFLTCKSDGTSSFLNIYPKNSSDATFQSTYVYGAQLEAGSYATSYIPTSGSTYQRQADVANGSGNSEVFNDSEGVLFADISYPITTSGSGNKRIAISNGTSSNRVMFAEIGNTGISALITSGGVNSAYITGNVNNLLSVKSAIKYKQNDFSLWVNGFEVGTDTSGLVPVGLSELAFDGGDGGNPFYGKTKELGYYDATLTDAELETLTSYRSLNELVTELNLNTL